jgi:hypothetical protein
MKMIISSMWLFIYYYRIRNEVEVCICAICGQLPSFVRFLSTGLTEIARFIEIQEEKIS